MASTKSIKKSLPDFFRFFKYFSPELKKQRTLITGSFLALMAEILLRLLEPWPLKFVIDRIIVTNPSRGQVTIPVIESLDPVMLLTIAALCVLAIAGLRALSSYYNNVGFALVGNRVLTEIRGKLYNHLQCLSLSFHNRSRSGDLTIRLISDIGMLKDVTVTAVLPLMANMLMLVGMISVMFWLNWKLTLLAITTIPLFWLSTIRLSRKIRDVSRKQRKREGAMAATAAESIGAIKVVQALSLDKQFSETFSGQNKKSLKEGVKAKRLAAGLERTVDVLIALSTAMVLWFGARLVLKSELSTGELIVFLAYLKSSFKPLQNFAKFTGRLAKASAAGERVLDLLEQKPDVYDLPGAVDTPPLKGEVCFSGVGFSYEPGHPVLEHIDFKVTPGRSMALVGGSGNGKSTLAGLILRLYDPSSGRVIIDGHDIRSYTLASLRSQISVVLQDTILFASSIRDNIAYGAPDASDGEIEDAARLANAHDFIEALPQGYDTAVGERGVTLSSGQRQRIAIARAAIRKAPILILDEPTTGLDEENEQAVSGALERLSQGKTTFLITHNLNHASHADCIIYMEKGTITECGTHDELMKMNGRYASMYKLQMRGIRGVITGGG